jgi:type IV pilus assembly protein PilM
VSEKRFSEAEKKVSDFVQQSNKYKSEYREAQTKCNLVIREGSTLVGALERRTVWLELYKAVSECLPRDAVEQRDIRLQNRILITKFTPRRIPDLAAWFSGLGTQAKEFLSEQDRKAPPSGPGYIVTLEGDHYHDATLGKGIAAGGDPSLNLVLYGRGYLQEQFLKKLQLWAVPSHDSSDEVKVGGIGITHATIVEFPQAAIENRDPTGETEIPQMAGAGAGRPGVGSWGGMSGNLKGMMNMNRHRDKHRDGGAMNPALDDLNFNDPSADPDKKTKDNRLPVSRYHFVIEFVWTPEKPRPNPAGEKGALASAAAPGGTAVGGKPSALGTASAATAPKK